MFQLDGAKDLACDVDLLGVFIREYFAAQTSSVTFRLATYRPSRDLPTQIQGIAIIGQVHGDPHGSLPTDVQVAESLKNILHDATLYPDHRVTEH